MRILEVAARGRYSKVAYGREGRELIARVNASLAVWSLETFEEEHLFAVNVPVAPLDCLFLSGGRSFLEANGYWGTDEELPGAAMPDRDRAQQVGAIINAAGFLCFSQDGRSFLRESYGQPWQSPERIALWDFASNCIRTYPQAGSTGASGACFSSDGSLLALAARGQTTKVTIWDAVVREPVAELEHTDQVFFMTFSPGGNRLATSAGRVVRIWSVPEGRCLQKFRAFRSYTECAAFSPDGTMLVAGSREGRARVWEVESGRELSDHDWRQGEVSDAAFSPDGSTAAAACRKAVVVWDVDI